MYSLLNFICLALLLLFNPFCFSPKTLTSGYLSIVRKFRNATGHEILAYSWSVLTVAGGPNLHIVWGHHLGMARLHEYARRPSLSSLWVQYLKATDNVFFLFQKLILTKVWEEYNRLVWGYPRRHNFSILRKLAAIFPILKWLPAPSFFDDVSCPMLAFKMLGTIHTYFLGWIFVYRCCEQHCPL